MENETNETREIKEIKDITPEIARDMTQEAINWDGIVQRAINDRVPEKAIRGQRECRIVIGLPDGMTAFTDTTQDIIKVVFVRKGWLIKDFSVDNRLGAILVDIGW
jgi:hypothetical protein